MKITTLVFFVISSNFFVSKAAAEQNRDEGEALNKAWLSFTFCERRICRKIDIATFFSTLFSSSLDGWSLRVETATLLLNHITNIELKYDNLVQQPEPNSKISA